jgi:hypothetical protein
LRALCGLGGVCLRLCGRCGADSAEAGRLGDAEVAVQLALTHGEFARLRELAVAGAEVALADLAERGADRAPGGVGARLGDSCSPGVSSPLLGTTPKGRKMVSELIGEIDVAKLEPQLAELPGAELADTHQTVLPPELAPPRWAAGIKELLDRSPFETNVLCMTRFHRPDEPDDPIADVFETVKTALASHGLHLHLASDSIVEDTLFANVAAYMWACQYGLALFEDRIGPPDTMGSTRPRARPLPNLPLAAAQSDTNALAHHVVAPVPFTRCAANVVEDPPLDERP